MNPVTRAILQGIKDPDLHHLVEDWDRLERMVIEVYKSKQVGEGVEEEHRRIKQQLEQALPRYLPALEPYWRQIRVEGILLDRDPFSFVLSASEPRDWIGNWPVMQHLPAAREALNHYLLDRSGG